MRFNFPSCEDYYNWKENWHKWYVVFPRRMPDGKLCSFEMIYRKGRLEPTGPLWSSEWHYDYEYTKPKEEDVQTD